MTTLEVNPKVGSVVYEFEIANNEIPAIIVAVVGAAAVIVLHDSA